MELTSSVVGHCGYKDRGLLSIPAWCWINPQFATSVRTSGECRRVGVSTVRSSEDHVSVLAAIPCRIVQGRYDVICPTVSAWELDRALPRSELKIVPDGAHSPLDPGMINELVQAADDFKTLY